mmetsp:Transcript_24344/g.60373  ORF Transcript_24344/g.60373 Transcript_24344/m.60373 type:complete len:321 (+) Transcript_24344:17-979(+)
MALALLLQLLSTSLHSTPASGAANNYWQCDRQCRDEFDFFNRDVVGNVSSSGIFRKWSCACWNHTAPLGATAYKHEGTPVTTSAGTFTHAQPFDADYWCDEYTTPFLCALPDTLAGYPRTIACGGEPLASCAAKARSRGLITLHCGRCGACSALPDIQVLYSTRHDITTHMTACARAFALSNMWPFGHQQQTLADLRSCLVSHGITFSTDGRGWEDPDGKPSCMDCWTDNILNDKVVCTEHCLSKFINPLNNRPYEEDSCLQCDEYSSGPAFIKCAGANRRSSGIVSDIDRGPGQICPVGYCSGKEVCFPDSDPILTKDT